MTGLQYTIRLQEPILANSLAGDANSARTLPYVPGGLIRGALIAAYLKNGNANAKDDKFRRLFLDGRTRYLHAWPMRQEKRGLPTPASWIAKKDELLQDENAAPANIYNLATASSIQEVREMAGDEEAKQEDFETLSAELAWLLTSTLYTQEPSLQFNLHTQRDAVFGRAREGSGAVFRYEALPAGLRVQGFILTANENDLTELENLLPQGTVLSLGKSRTAGYGRVIVDDKPVRLPDDWREGWKWPAPQDEGNDAAEPKLIITFLSPAILRDAHGQYTLDPTHALSTRLKVAADTLKKEKAFCKPEIVGGFNRTWGLPLPQAWAVRPGSVFVYKLAGDTKPAREDLLGLEKTGLGERRAEGFGSIAVDWQQPKSLFWKQEKQDDFSFGPNAETLPLSEDAEEMGRMMQKRLLKNEMEEHLRDAVRSIKIVSEITNSQLSRWRVVVRAALSQEKDETRSQDEARLDFVLDFAGKRDNKPKPSWKKLQHVRIKWHGTVQHASLAEWIKEILENDETFWKQMNFTGSYPDNIPSIRLGDLTPLSPDSTMITKYKLRLIDAVLAKHAKPPEPPSQESET
jgi:CRISPR-associated protein Csx10